MHLLCRFTIHKYQPVKTVVLDPAVAGSHNLIVVILSCIGTTFRVDVSSGTYQAPSCADNGGPDITETLYAVGLLSETRGSLTQQVDLGKDQQYDDTPTVKGASKQEMCAIVLWAIIRNILHLEQPALSLRVPS